MGADYGGGLATCQGICSGFSDSYCALEPLHRKGLPGRFGLNQAGNARCCALNSEVRRQNENCCAGSVRTTLECRRWEQSVGAVGPGCGPAPPPRRSPPARRTGSHAERRFKIALWDDPRTWRQLNFGENSLDALAGIHAFHHSIDLAYYECYFVSMRLREYTAFVT